jgi:HSP20 family molecular chaperone IbpA
MTELDRLLDQLERVIVEALRTADSSGGVGEAEATQRLNTFLSARVSARVGYLDEIGLRPSLGHLPARKTPSVDLIEDEDSLKVIVLLPGVKKDDVRVLAGARSIRVEIRDGGRDYVKNIPCAVKADQVKLESVVENNSVLEFTFAKNSGVSNR